MSRCSGSLLSHAECCGWIPATGYLTAQEVQRDISHYLMHRYNWIRPHQFNGWLPPAVAEEKLNPLSGMD